MRFALLTADGSHRNRFTLNPETEDATSFMQWVSIFRGVHLSFEGIRQEGDACLRDFDVVMMSGHPKYIVDIIRIGKFLKDSQTITMFYPEGSLHLYDNSINGFHPEYYEAWRACDILSIAEEDKVSYYNAFVDRKETIVRFIHVPTTPDMSASIFVVPRERKTNSSLVYGDNNPNHPLIALAAIERMRDDGYLTDAIAVETRDAAFGRIFPNLPVRQVGKQGLNQFLRILGQTIVNFYPTEWIGTARHQISCAAVGTPCIGSKDSHTQMRLFPKLAVNIYDIQAMVELARELVRNEKFYREIVDYALAQMRYYDLGTTVSRFVGAVNAAHDAFKKKTLVAA